ncbi:MAG: prepilin-type N-terminal cleavage/methylation domain-containing protein [Actinobacteria bacterium]|nr:prepilin-type N-terminal cleavage/methylation domain-containing protein [Actinomycetota bacterium]
MKLKKISQNKIQSRLIDSRGFSLIEMIIVVSIIAVIAGIISSVYITSIKSQEQVLNKAKSETDMRTALYVITKDIRGASNVSSADTDYFKFKSDINNDSIIEDIEYILSLSNGRYVLYKKINGGNNIFILDYITNNNIFSYFATSAGSELVVPLSIQDMNSFKLIKISFDINREPANPARATILSTVVSLRNRL